MPKIKGKRPATTSPPTKDKPDKKKKKAARSSDAEEEYYCPGSPSYSPRPGEPGYSPPKGGGDDTNFYPPHPNFISSDDEEDKTPETTSTPTSGKPEEEREESNESSEDEESEESEEPETPGKMKLPHWHDKAVRFWKKAMEANPNIDKAGYQTLFTQTLEVIYGIYKTEADVEGRVEKIMEKKYRQEDEKREKKKKQDEGEKKKMEKIVEELAGNMRAIKASQEKNEKEQEERYAKLSKQINTMTPQHADHTRTTPPAVTYATMAGAGPPTDTYQEPTLTVLLGLDGKRATEQEFKKTKMDLGKIASTGGTKILDIRQSAKGNAVLSFATIGDRNNAKTNLNEKKKNTWDENDKEIPIHAKGLRAKTGEEEEVEKDLKANNQVLEHTKFIWLDRGKEGEKYRVPKIITNRTTAQLLLKTRLTTSTYESHKLEIWKVTVHTCPKCLVPNPNHPKANCPKDPICRNCGDSGHAQEQCHAQSPKCFWCTLNKKQPEECGHAAQPQECPWHKAMTAKASNDLEHFVAGTSRT